MAAAAECRTRAGPTRRTTGARSPLRTRTPSLHRRCSVPGRRRATTRTRAAARARGPPPARSSGVQRRFRRVRTLREEVVHRGPHGAAADEVAGVADRFERAGADDQVARGHDDAPAHRRPHCGAPIPASAPDPQHQPAERERDGELDQHHEPHDDSGRDVSAVGRQQDRAEDPERDEPVVVTAVHDADGDQRAQPHPHQRIDASCPAPQRARARSRPRALRCPGRRCASGTCRTR